MGVSESIRTVDVSGADWVGRCRPDMPELRAVLERLVELPEGQVSWSGAWRIALAGSATFVRMLGARTALIRLRTGPVRDVAVRVDVPRPNTLWRITGAAAGSTARRRCAWAQRLRAVGIEAPEPLAFSEHAELPAMRMSLLATEYSFGVEGDELRDLAWPGFGRAADVSMPGFQASRLSN